MPDEAGSDAGEEGSVIKPKIAKHGGRWMVFFTAVTRPDWVSKALRFVDARDCWLVVEPRDAA
ncbi:MAG TPA: hypothetical protein VGD45_20515 [Steroidobacter sp.]|uniref:hypothetical protein n=1 Tax=Steroidobacter sp. TaxID=1978227 RepID=UPI002ED8266D